MKKSSSTVSGLSATIKPALTRFGGLLDLSDEEDEIWFSPPTKKTKSDLGPSNLEEHNFSDLVEDLEAEPSQIKAKRGEMEANLFPEMSSSAPGPLLPDELQSDIANASHYLYKPSKPFIEDHCSSSSEFEIDEDSSDEESEIPAPTASLALNSSAFTDSITDTCASASYPTSSPSLTPIEASLFSMSPKPSFPIVSSVPKHQAAITNYFGMQRKDGTTANTTKLVLPNSSVFSKKRALPAPTPSKPAITVSNDTEEEEKPWFREPSVKESCPFYKRIPGSTFIVDDFRFIYKTPITNAFFLTHFHSDHYQGLNSKFDRGVIYCSPITGSLLETVLRVPPQFIQTIPLRTPVMVEGVEVIFFDANHCPGAVVILFRLADGTLHLHTGDFRFDADLPDHLQLLALQGKVANLYLDTTYADSRYTFPHQQLVISRVIDLVAPHVKEPKTLIVVGTYTIGKERMFLALAERFGLKFYVKPSKLRILKCLDMELILREMATNDTSEARIHVIPIFEISIKKLETFLDSQSSWSRVIAIRPTGWAYSSPKKSKATSSGPPIDAYIGTQHTQKKTNLEKADGFSTHSGRRGSIVIHSAPYSEHSSFSELCTFTRALKPRWIIPTVNNRSREAVTEMVRNLRG